ncbi:MAG TPA: hypothetical protein VIW92_04970, partial [Thermoanaerobaculia bacterium]
IQEFSSRFAAEEETSPLFQAMRRLGQLDSEAILAGEATGWGEWPPDDPDDPGGGTRLTVRVS